MMRLLIIFMLLLFAGEIFCASKSRWIRPSRSPYATVRVWQFIKTTLIIAGINNNYGTAGGLPVVQANSTVIEQLTTLQQTYSNPANNKSSTNASSNQVTAQLAASMPLYAGAGSLMRRTGWALWRPSRNRYINSRGTTLIYNVMLKLL